MYPKGHNVPEESQCILYRRGARGAIQPIQQESCGEGGFGQVLQLQSMPYGKSRDFFFSL
jgi:hypothetical protein